MTRIAASSSSPSGRGRQEIARLGSAGVWVMCLSLVLLAFVECADAQEAFAVASVKPSAPTAVASRYGTRAGGTFTAVNVTVKTLVMLAYGVREAQLRNMPGWMSTERFDVEATRTQEWGPASAAAPPAALLPALQRLLEQRFALATRWEKRKEQVLALVRRTPLTSLKASAADCTEPAMQALAGTERRCGTMMHSAGMTAWSISMPELASLLMVATHASVVDATELAGRYDVELHYRPESPTSTTDTQTDAPSLSAALTEQLGLGLERREALVDLLVIVSGSRPTAN